MNLTCRIQEDKDTSAVSSDSEEEEEEVQQLILAIGGRRRPFEGILRLCGESKHT